LQLASIAARLLLIDAEEFREFLGAARQRLGLAAVPLIEALSMGSRLDPAMPDEGAVVDCLFLDQYPVGSATPEYLSFDAL